MTTSAPDLILRASDDSMHKNTGEPTFNESAYFNFYDPQVRLGGFVRIGNRPNEGHAEMTVCLYPPGGGAAFMFWRAEISGNEGFEAAGLRFEMPKPLSEQRISYDGSCCMLADPLDLLDPRRAFAANPHAPVTIELRYEALSEAFGGEPSIPRPHAPEFFRGHFEQHGHATGRIAIDGAEYALDGFGLRDRSWGPRTWQALERYRWLTMNFGSSAGIAAALDHRAHRPRGPQRLRLPHWRSERPARAGRNRDARRPRPRIARATDRCAAPGRRAPRADRGPCGDDGAAPQPSRRRHDADRGGPDGVALGRSRGLWLVGVPRPRPARSLTGSLRPVGRARCLRLATIKARESSAPVWLRVAV